MDREAGEVQAYAVSKLQKHLAEIQEDIDKYDVKLEKLRKKGAPRPAATARAAPCSRAACGRRRAQKRRARRTRRRERK